MQDRLKAMQTALRVLHALTERCSPDSADVAELQRLAPLVADSPPDELACNVIMQAIRRGKEIRKAGAGH